jgi:hypothetical protein
MTVEELKGFIKESESPVHWLSPLRGGPTMLGIMVRPQHLESFAKLLGRDFLDEYEPHGQFGYDGSIWFNLSAICLSFRIDPEKIHIIPYRFY